MDKAAQYKLAELIGEGSYGKVYKALSLETREFVALKFIPKIAHNENELRFLRREFEIHSKLDHRNIIKMLDYYDSEKELVLITECAKCSLGDLIHPGEPPNFERAQKIACDITSALFYLHSERILHRDLKPQNVLIGYDGLPKVCDFGFAKNMALDTFLLTSFKGTPLYMAPEIMTHKPYDHKTDLWSFGCILYELLVGVPPFNATEVFQLSKMIQEPIKWDKRITGHCLSFLQGLLEKNHRKRLGWPDLLDHPYVCDAVSVNRKVGEFALTKALSPSQEFAKETQRQDIQRNPGNHNGLFLAFKPGTKKGLPKFNGNFKGMHPAYMHTPGSNLIMVQNGQIASLYNHFHGMQPPLTQAPPKPQQKTEYRNPPEEDLESSDSSVHTLSSSSEDESEDEKATVVVESGKSESSRGQENSQSSRQPLDVWISGTRLALDRPIQEDPIEVEDEWLAYLHKNIKEVIKNPESLCEKYSFRLIVQPLRNQYTGVVVVEKIAFLLSLPFTIETKKDPILIRNLESVYLESKVVANLIYASKLVVIRRKLDVGSLESNEISDVLTNEDLEAMDKCIRLVCFLIHSDDRFIVQFCDSILGFQAYVLFQLFLKLDKKRPRLISDTLAILCHLMRTLPGNVSILEDILLGTDEHSGEFWRLLSHTDSIIQSTTLRILGYLVIHSAKARDQCITTNSAKLWRILRNASAQPDSQVVSAAEFAAESVRHVGSPNSPSRPIQQTSLPIKF